MMRFLIAIFFALVLIPAQGQEAYPVENGKVLLDGYDPVGYFRMEVLKGDEQFAYLNEGRKILFANQENLEMFEANPNKYLPAYGGWCAIAMVDQNFVVPDYTLYKIQDGALMFFSVKAFFNGLTEWEKSPDKNKIKADGNYREIFSN